MRGEVKSEPVGPVRSKESATDPAGDIFGNGAYDILGLDAVLGDDLLRVTLSFDGSVVPSDEAKNPVNDEDSAGEIRRVLRGGAYVLEIEDLRSALRYRLSERDRTPYIGFRTVVPGVQEDS